MGLQVSVSVSDLLVEVRWTLTGGSGQTSLGFGGQNNLTIHGRLIAKSQSGPRQCQSRNGNSIRMPSSWNTVMVFNSASKSTLVVLPLPSVAVMISHAENHGSGVAVVVGDAMPGGKLSLGPEPSVANVTEHIQPIGQFKVSVG